MAETYLRSDGVAGGRKAKALEKRSVKRPSHNRKGVCFNLVGTTFNKPTVNSSAYLSKIGNEYTEYSFWNISLGAQAAGPHQLYSCHNP